MDNLNFFVPSFSRVQSKWFLPERGITHFRNNLLFFIFLSFFCACTNEYTPKPRGFFRIDFPAKKYSDYNTGCPFVFQYPDYAIPVNDPDPGAEPCWINIEFPSFKATLHLSYKSLANNKLRSLTEDSRTLAMKHTIKAEEINERPFVTRNGIFGLMYDIKGNTASSVQFYLTDTLHNFIRGSLYFNVTPNADSIAPVAEFINKDIDRFIDTFRWKY